MHRTIFTCFVVFITAMFFFSYALAGTEPRIEVLVTIAPHKYFVERIAGKEANVHTLIPTGANSHTYEPTPKQVLTAGKADIWFRLGEPMENNMLSALCAHGLQIVDLREGISLISYDRPHTCSQGGGCNTGEDLHYWLSPVESRVQAKTIADALSAHAPEKSDFFQQNLRSFLADLEKLQKELSGKLRLMKQRTIAVSHPAYSYFCRDFALKQVSIEFEGKDPSPRQLTQTLEALRAMHTTKIFVQPQFQNKGAALVAKQIGAILVMIDPYSEDYFGMMRELGKKIAEH